MKTSLAIAFLSGQYDPENKQESKKAKIVQARLSKPRTTVVKVVSDWAVDEKAKGGRPKKPRVRKEDKRIYAIEGIPAVMQTGGGRYQVQIKHWGRNFYLGVFDTVEQAIHARDTAKAQLKAGTFKHKGKIAVDERVKKSRELPKYIYYNPIKDRYLIQRTIDGRKFSYGTYHTLEEAVNKLKELGI